LGKRPDLPALLAVAYNQNQDAANFGTYGSSPAAYEVVKTLMTRWLEWN
jgi:hypothetical protein